MSQQAIGERARIVEEAVGAEGAPTAEALSEVIGAHAAEVGRVYMDLVTRGATKGAPTEVVHAEVRALVERAVRASGAAQGTYHAARRVHGDEATRHVGDLVFDCAAVVRVCRVLAEYVLRPTVVADGTPADAGALPSGGE